MHSFSSPTKPTLTAQQLVHSNDDERTYEINFHCRTHDAHVRFLSCYSADIVSTARNTTPPLFSVHVKSPAEKNRDGDDVKVREVFQSLRTTWLGNTIIIQTPCVTSTQDVFKRLLSTWEGSDGGLGLGLGGVGSRGGNAGGNGSGGGGGWKLLQTDDDADHISSKHGWIVIGDRQTAGRGRRGNVWLSPTGSLSLSVNVRIDIAEQQRRRQDVQLEQMVIFIQYITAIAICDACNGVGTEAGEDKGGPGCPSPQMRIKWPNDVFDSRNMGKVAGILCEASVVYGQVCNMVIGIGVNFSAGTEVEGRTVSHVSSVSKQQFLVAFLNRFDALYAQLSEQYQFDFAASPLAQRYTDLWLHSNQRVAVGHAHGPKAVIKGLAPNGYVRIRHLRDGDGTEGAEEDLVPHATSLDVEAGIIRPKQ